MIPKPETVERWPHLQKISQELNPYEPEVGVELLIGFNCSAALLPRQVIAAGDDDPFAVRTDLGWGITGIMANSKKENSPNHSHFAFRTQVREVSPIVVGKMFERECEEEREEKGLSVEDKNFTKLMNEEIHQRDDDHFQLPLPLKKNTVLPNNKTMALKRLNGLKRKLCKGEQYQNDYKTFMNNLMEQNFAEKIPSEELNGEEGCVWYIPHHGVYLANQFWTRWRKSSW